LLRDIHAQTFFAGIQSIHGHAYEVQCCDLVLIDEAHNAENYFRNLPNSNNKLYEST
jgi:hypothetical protein